MRLLNLPAELVLVSSIGQVDATISGRAFLLVL